MMNHPLRALFAESLPRRLRVGGTLLLAACAWLAIPTISHGAFTAYNDLVWNQGELSGNITTGSPLSVTTFYLVNYTNGAQLPVQAAFSVTGGTCERYGATCSTSPIESDAYQLFNGRLTLTNDYVVMSTGVITVLSLSGLDPYKRYTLALFSTRGASGPNYTGRLAVVTLTGADVFTNNSSAGITRFGNITANDSGRMSCDNLDGKLFRYDGINAGPNGHIALVVSAAVDRAYINAFLLQEFDSARPYLIPTNTAWRYRDQGSEPSGSWKQTAYDDSTWSSGSSPLGYAQSVASTSNNIRTFISYGTNSTNKFITSYFRTTLSVTNVAALQDVQCHITFDDGVIVYVNGTEVWRNNMPAGSVGYTNLSTGGISISETNQHAFTISADAFSNGLNCIAAEVHQSGPGSSDTYFDMWTTWSTNQGLDYGVTGLQLVSSSTPLRMIWEAEARRVYRIMRKTSVTSSAWQQYAVVTASVNSVSVDVPMTGPASYFKLLALAEMPPTVDNFTGASAIGSTAVTLNGSLTSTGASPTSVYVCWDITDKGAVSTGSWAHVDSLGIQSVGTFIDPISGLNPDSIYNYRCYAVNATGSTFAATSASFRTSILLSAPTLSSPSAVSITTNGATLGATITGIGNAALNSRGTVWGTTAVPSANALTEGSTNVGTFSHARTGMTPGTLYYYRGFAANFAGMGYSADGSFYTEPQESSALGMSTVASNQMEISWTTNGSHAEGSLVIVRDGSDPATVPTDGTTYTANPTYALGTAVGNGYVAFMGTGTVMTLLGVNTGHTYYARIYTYVGNGAALNYQQDNPVTGNYKAASVAGPLDTVIRLAQGLYYATQTIDITTIWQTNGMVRLRDTVNATPSGYQTVYVINDQQYVGTLENAGPFPPYFNVTVLKLAAQGTELWRFPSMSASYIDLSKCGMAEIFTGQNPSGTNTFTGSTSTLQRVIITTAKTTDWCPTWEKIGNMNKLPTSKRVGITLRTRGLQYTNCLARGLNYQYGAQNTPAEHMIQLPGTHEAGPYADNVVGKPATNWTQQESYNFGYSYTPVVGVTGDQYAEGYSAQEVRGLFLQESSTYQWVWEGMRDRAATMVPRPVLLGGYNTKFDSYQAFTPGGGAWAPNSTANRDRLLSPSAARSGNSWFTLPVSKVVGAVWQFYPWSGERRSLYEGPYSLQVLKKAETSWATNGWTNSAYLFCWPMISSGQAFDFEHPVTNGTLYQQDMPAYSFNGYLSLSLSSLIFGDGLYAWDDGVTYTDTDPTKMTVDPGDVWRGINNAPRPVAATNGMPRRPFGYSSAPIVAGYLYGEMTANASENWTFKRFQVNGGSWNEPGTNNSSVLEAAAAYRGYCIGCQSNNNYSIYYSNPYAPISGETVTVDLGSSKTVTFDCYDNEPVVIFGIHPGGSVTLPRTAAILSRSNVSP